MIDGALDCGGAVYGQYGFRQFAKFAADFRFAERLLEIAAMAFAGFGALPAVGQGQCDVRRPQSWRQSAHRWVFGDMDLWAQCRDDIGVVEWGKPAPPRTAIAARILPLKSGCDASNSPICQKPSPARSAASNCGPPKPIAAAPTHPELPPNSGKKTSPNFEKAQVFQTGCGPPLSRGLSQPLDDFREREAARFVTIEFG